MDLIHPQMLTQAGIVAPSTHSGQGQKRFLVFQICSALTHPLTLRAQGLCCAWVLPFQTTCLKSHGTQTSQEVFLS